MSRVLGWGADFVRHLRLRATKTAVDATIEKCVGSPWDWAVTAYEFLLAACWGE